MKTQLNNLLTLIVMFLGINVLAQNGNIKGSIKTSDGQPAEFVTVALTGTTLSSVANSEGEYEIKSVPIGIYTLKTSFVGLEQKELKVEVKSNETTIVPEITLKENAQELKEVVVFASRNKYNNALPSSSLRLITPIFEVPQNIQTIGGAELKEQQILTMSDGVVRNVSGSVRAEHWGDLYTNITSRGSQVQAFRNGFNVVNSYWGPLTEDMCFVDHIEFVKGPAGFMLSSGDGNGLYNVVTKIPSGQNKGEVTMTMGSYDLYRTSLDLDGKISNNGKLLYRLNLAAQNKNSFRANEYNNRYVFAPVVSYQIDDKTKLTFEYTYQRANMSNVGSYYVFSTEGFGTLPVDFTSLPAGTPGTTINDHSSFVNLQHDFNKNWKITGQLSYFLYDQKGTSMWPSSIDSTGKMIRNIGLWDALSEMTMGQVFVNGDVTTGQIRHRILAGLDVSNKNYLADWNQGHDLDSPDEMFDPKNPNLGTPVNGYPVFDRSKSLEERAYAAGSFIDQRYASFYIQDELGFLDNKLRLTLAGRYTNLVQAYYGADSASAFTPRIGLSGSITNTFAIYALYDQAFSPQSGQLANGGKVKPITGDNMEIGFKKDWFDGKWKTTLAIYRIVKRNELTADPYSPPASGLSIELGEKTAQGIEFDLKGTIINGLDVIANYAYTDSRVTKLSEGVTVLEVDDIVPGYCKHTINGWVNYKIQTGVLKGTGISGGFTWLLDRATYWEESPVGGDQLDDYFKLDAGLFWENNKIRITGNVFNALNKYLYSGSYASYFSAPVYSYQTEAPRNFRLSINYKF
jgi:iron complex outermembrane recepter protein